MCAVILILLCALTCCAQEQEVVARNWQMRLARIKLFSFAPAPPSTSYLRPQNFGTTISWQDVQDRERVQSYSRVGGANIPLRLGHIVAASLMALSASEVISVQS